MKKILFVLISCLGCVSLALPLEELKQKTDLCIQKKSGEACVPTGYHHEELRNYSEALKLYDVGCSLKDNDACNNGNNLRNKMCYVESITSECDKAPIAEKYKFIESFKSSTFDSEKAMKRIYKYTEDKDFFAALHNFSDKAETPFICSATQMIASDKYFPGKTSFQQDFGSKWMIKNPKGSLNCISQLDPKTLKRIESALTANPYENWAEDAKFAMCQDDVCRKKVLEYYEQQTLRIKQVDASPDIQKDTIQFYLALLNTKIEKTKKEFGKE